MARKNEDMIRVDAGPGMQQTERDSDPWKLSTFGGRVRAYLDMIFVDHGFFRYVYLNFHQVAPGVFRSAQPAPHHVRRFRRAGVKTVVNLRGGRDIAAYALEREACIREGIAFEELRLRSREAPDVDTIEQVAALLERVEYPILVHCKSGADRAGLMSALTVILREGGSAREARRQLSPWYGHVRQGPTGVLDAFIDSYAEAEKAAGGKRDFLDWARSDYDRAAVTQTFRASGWARWLIDKVLKRE